ncbi:DUF4179 domain-containing protein [Paenibacillus sp. GYB004]|uniref:DUF4179 domain-containing protein n=1 Tax=Paenibacillus sp. GYB004 TaxID=2994393 RepID=UPI002F9653B4
MEDKLKALLDRLDADETGKLLDDDLSVPVDRKIAARIKANVYEKAGFRPVRARRQRKRLTAAAALLFLLAVLASMNLDSVTATIGKIFGYVPGYGIIEPEGGIKYGMQTPGVTAENEVYRLTLNEAIASGNKISVLFTLERKQFTQPDNGPAAEEKERLLRERSQRHEVTLQAGEAAYNISHRGWGTGGKFDIVYGDFILPESEIKPGTEYRLHYAYSGLTIAFTLQSYERFHSLEQIGPTVVHGPLSVTAVSSWSDDKLTVNLYPYSTGGYKLSSFTKDPYNDKLQGDLHLITDQGPKPYIQDRSPYVGVRKQFQFDRKDDGESNPVLHIPHVTLESKEAAAVTLKIPDMGERRTVNKALSFKDADVTVLDTEKVMHTDGNSGTVYEALKIRMSFQNKSDAFKLNWVYLDVDSTGDFGWEFDENGDATTYYLALTGYDKSSIKLTIRNPKYRITEGFRIALQD